MSTCFLRSLRLAAALAIAATLVSAQSESGKKTRLPAANPPIYIAFHWHMHQPIYWPYESVIQTDQNSRMGYSVADIHNQRTGPYTTWPKDAVQKGINAGLPHFGAQVSFSGSLIENLNNLEANGNGNFSNWKSSWNYIRGQKTSLNNPRLDMVAFGYHHPLMGLLDGADIRRQIALHKQVFASNFSNGTYSKGMFPPENAFSPRMIPALAEEGIQWVMVDNAHFDRTCQGYPFSTGGNLYEPNKADIRNPNPNDWVQLNGLWAPTRNSARWGRQPHYVQYIDPATGVASKIIAVPTDRYMGNEDGRGGFGALNYDAVMSQLESYNTDPSHPILIVLHHDGDNYGGGSESYYNSNFQNFVNWVQANPSRFVCTTVQDYLDTFPPDPNDIIHVEDGSWSGADNGDPEFLKWNGDPSGGYSPDRNSWGVVTAAKNYVFTANQINPNAANTQNAWKYLLNAQTSCYWYWDGSQGGLWDSHPARACNQAISYAQPVVAGGSDQTPPTIYLPQREPYNPGGTEWGISKPSDFKVWTYAYDVSGLNTVTLRYRTDADGVLSSTNATYAGGSGVGSWNDLTMTGIDIAPQTNPAPTAKAKEYSATIAGQHDVMIDYYVEALDGLGNIARSPIMHVWVGQNVPGGDTGGGGSSTVSWVALNPTLDDPITITVTGATQGAKLHWGVNNVGSSWQQPNQAYWPPNTVLFGGTGPAVETPFSGPDTSGKLTLTIGPFNNPVQSVTKVAFVVHFNNNTWDNNGGSDYHITVSGGGEPPASFTMDGTLDAGAVLASNNGGINLYCAFNGTDLYVASQSAQSQGGDIFILVADSQRAPVAAPWGKAGTAAAWKVFLGNESTNNWSGWFNSAGSGTSNGVAATAGSIVEGTVNLGTVFGSVPSKVYLAVAKYATADGGALTGQSPAGDGDNALEPEELYLYQFSVTPVVAPGAPVPVFPDEGVLDQPLTVTFRWHPDTLATLYHLQLSADSLFGGSFIVNDSSITDTQKTAFGLAQQSRMFWRVRAKNIAGRSPWSATRRLTTTLLPPQAVTLLLPAHGAVLSAADVAFRWRKSSVAVTGYRIQVGNDSAFTGIAADSTITDTSLTLPGFAWNTTYFWRVRAINAAGTSPYSAVRSFQPFQQTTVSVNVGMAAGWNMISNPLLVENDSAAAVFIGGGILAGPFGYSIEQGYQPEARLQSGRGYWMKFSAATTYPITGMAVAADSIPLTAGWNLIGSIGSAVDVSTVSMEPAGLQRSPFFGYQGGYIPSSVIQPGKAYWVKSSGAGYLILQKPMFTLDE